MGRARRLMAFALLGLTPAPAQARDELWEPGEATTSQVRGEIREPRRASGDGVYGRFDGDLDFGMGLGVVTMQDDALGAARLTLHYYSTLGLYAGYADALGQTGGVERLAFVGVDVKPLFIPRWSRDAQQGPPTVDLFIDSLSLGMGAFLAEPSQDAFGSARGLELGAGLGLPLAGRAGGPWLEARYQWRWVNPGGDSQSRHHAVLIVLSWHAVFLGLSNHDDS